jgi:hypothetical protein
MAYGIPEKQILLLQDTLMQIGLEMLMIERAPWEDASMLNNLVAWMSKKQASISLSTAEAEYIVAGSCCTQLLWMKTLLGDYGFSQGTMIINCDNTSAINISKNPVQHSRTKHIDIRHHFLRDLVESEVVYFSFIPTENQLADILTKPLDGSRFESLRKAIGVCDMS